MIEGIITTLGSLFTVMDKLMEKLPNYEQRKKEEFYKKQRKFIKTKMEVECELALDEWDHKKMLDYFGELEMMQKDINNFVDIFIKEIR